MFHFLCRSKIIAVIVACAALITTVLSVYLDHQRTPGTASVAPAVPYEDAQTLFLEPSGPLFEYVVVEHEQGKDWIGGEWHNITAETDAEAARTATEGDLRAIWDRDFAKIDSPKVRVTFAVPGESGIWGAIYTRPTSPARWGESVSTRIEVGIFSLNIPRGEPAVDPEQQRLSNIP